MLSVGIDSCVFISERGACYAVSKEIIDPAVEFVVGGTNERGKIVIDNRGADILDGGIQSATM